MSRFVIGVSGGYSLIIEQPVKRGSAGRKPLPVLILEEWDTQKRVVLARFLSRSAANQFENALCEIVGSFVEGMRNVRDMA